jgi:hypothetical protein
LREAARSASGPYHHEGGFLGGGVYRVELGSEIRPRDKVREDKVLDKVVCGRVEGSGPLGERALPS